MKKLAPLLFILLLAWPLMVSTSDPITFNINTKKWGHVLDDHFISITVNPTDLLQGKVYGLAMNSTMAILKGLAPAYVRIGSADTAKYTFKRNRYPVDTVKPEDEYTVTETHWMVFNEVTRSAGLDVIVCLNAAHRLEGTKKWDTRNSLDLISFSDSQGYNLTWQLGYEIQSGEELSGLQFGKDVNSLRTILNAFPRYQQAKLIGPDIRVIHKRKDVEFWNDVLAEAGSTLDAVTWHPRWPQPSKMKVSEDSDLGYEFPHDYLEHDKIQLNKILQKSSVKNPVWIGETKRESTGTFAEGLIWARRLLLAAKSGIEVVMKQPNLMDITHPKPEYWIALLHKRLLGKSVLETRSMTNHSDVSIISHCTNPYYWSDKPEKLQDGPVTVYGVNMGSFEQKIQIKGTWTGKSQLMFQYVLTSGSDPDSVFSQMTYLNGEPLMMTDDGLLPEIVPRIRKLEKGLVMKLPPYSIGFWVIPEARVKICQVPPNTIPTITIETPANAVKTLPKNLENIRDINQFLVEKLKNPESDSEETPETKIEVASAESSEKDISLSSKENTLQRIARKIRQISPYDLSPEIKTIMEETESFLMKPDIVQSIQLKEKLPKATPLMEQRLQTIAEGISDAIKTTNQEQEFNKFLQNSGLNKDFGSLLMNDRRYNAPGVRNYEPFFDPNDMNPMRQRLRRSITASEETSGEFEDVDDEEKAQKFAKKLAVKEDEEQENYGKQDLVIPHQPDFKGLEERYKFIVKSKIQDGKRKISGIKRKIKHEDIETNPKVKQPERINDIQEEIIKKEIELLEKTEETVADILKSQKKRQETFEDIIFDELNDVKDERISALKEIQKNQRKNSIVKRQAQTPLTKPLLKTVEYIEKNFNLEPESVRKIKRSLEEKMGEMLRNYDTKKSLEVKKRMTQQKEEKKLKKFVKEEEGAQEVHEDQPRKSDDDHSKPTTRKSISKSHHATKAMRKPEATIKFKKVEETKKKPAEEEEDSFEMFNKKILEEPVKKPAKRRLLTEAKEEKLTKPVKKSIRKEQSTEITKAEPSIKKKRDDKKKDSSERETSEEVKEKEKETTEVKETKEKKESKESKESKQTPEKIPLKNDRERRENMLKQISNMVDHMQSMEQKEKRSKRMDEDDGISEEFDTDISSRKHKRRPRKADVVDILPKETSVPVQPVQSVETISQKVETATEGLVVPITPGTKPGKPRKHRVRPNRRLKDLKKIGTPEEKEGTQTKRHAALELDRKKLLKSKPKKLLPKFHKHGNELPAVEEKQTEVAEIVQTPAPEITEPPLQKKNEELLKDLEKIAEEKTFLDQGSGSSKEKSVTNGEEFLKRIKPEIDFSRETPKPTEDYIVVEPTTEPGMKEDLAKKTVGSALIENTNRESQEDKEKSEEEKLNENHSKQPEEDCEEGREKQSSDEERQLEDQKNQVQISKKIENPIKNADNQKEASPKAEKSWAELPETLSLENPTEELKEKTHEEVIKAPPKVEELTENEKITETDNNQRRRRATFLTHRRGSQEDEEEDGDYSSEERIQKFKQMIYKNSPTKKVMKNEVRPSGIGSSLGADEFIRMAGSTVRVMFDDVIPEAYGQTKTKIQNMGIPEYIKEFGKIVQQMKNLDQIFLNIGEAAVKGYIKGNRAEKGPYIQVISRKRRSPEAMTPEDTPTTEPAFGLATPGISTTEGSSGDTISQTKTVTTGRNDSGGFGSSGRKINQGLYEVPGWRIPAPWTTSNTETTEATQIPQMVLTTPQSASVPLTKPLITLQNQVPKIAKQIQPLLKSAEKLAQDSTPDDLQAQISPWIKTTKDFIQQAFTTLQRQRELSEIIASDFIAREAMTKAVEKRQAPKLPVYHMVPSSRNRKRDTQQKSDESVIRQLRGLQPGVYVVPTEEMTNIRSEQITNEAKQKSGMPNVVTLNIYYDKKNTEGKAATSVQTAEPALSQDAVTYYQNKPWGQYDQNNQYVTPNINSLPVAPAFPYAPDPRIGQLPSSRLIQYPASAFHYPPTPKVYPPIVPNPQALYANPVYYLPQDTRFVPPSPGTKRQWREFKARNSGLSVPSSYNNGWNLQYETVPGSVRSSLKPLAGNSYNKNFKLFTDKKRSIGGVKESSNSESALPFWKFFSTSSSEKNEVKEFEEKSETATQRSAEEESSEDVTSEKTTRETKETQKPQEEESKEESEEVAEDDVNKKKSRRRRSADNLPTRKLVKRSYPYHVDVLPEWFGTYREIDNTLDSLPSDIRRSQIVSSPWSDEDEELLSILEADDELPLADLDNEDYYFASDNTLTSLRRYPRSTDNMIKTNTIYKLPTGFEHAQLRMTGLKKLSDEDSSLELVTKPKTSVTPQTTVQLPLTTTSTQTLQPLQPLQIETATPRRNPNDDTLYYFFKYAYDSFVHVMKSMTELF